MKLDTIAFESLRGPNPQSGPPRWTAVVTYRRDAGSTSVTHQFEELDELHELIEAGWSWHAIESITVTLTKDPKLTIEQCEAL